MTDDFDPHLHGMKKVWPSAAFAKSQANESENTTLKCISPIDTSIYAERPVFSFDKITTILETARKVQHAWAARLLYERISLVKAGAERLGEMNAEIVPELAWMMGQPVRYGGEFKGVNERASYIADIAETALSPIIVEESENFERRILRQPHGLVFVLAPWNYPYMRAINTVVPALIAGNAVVLKPSTQTLLVGEHMVQAFREAGLPEGLFSNLFLNHATTEALIASKSFNFINFTGSVQGCQRIERAAAGTFTGLGLEMGGKDPAYVMAGADVDAAAETLVDAAMNNSGQCCCGIERIYVIESLYKDFVEKAVSVLHGCKVTGRGGALSVIGYHNLTRPKSYHFKKAT